MMKRSVLFLSFFLLTPLVFAAVPIQGRSLMGISATDARKKVLSAAESYLGTRYRYGGVDKGGMDCSGLVYTSFKDGLNYSTPRTAAGIYDWTERIDTADLQPGDLVFFITVGTRVSHVGIYAGSGRFIHSASEGPQTGVMYSRLDESYWRRTYRGAGRALPWDSGDAQVFATTSQDSGGASIVGSVAAAGSSSASPSPSSTRPSKYWAEPGFFTGFGAAWTWGGFFEGSSSVFRGIALQATAGYKGTKYRAGLELRPEWDRALGVFRLPLTLSVGTDTFQIFAGPAYTFGDPGLSTADRERDYSGGRTWLGELGFSSAFPHIKFKQGSFSLYGELAWQPYHWEEGEKFTFKPDVTANLRVSTGVRYLWKL